MYKIAVINESELPARRGETKKKDANIDILKSAVYKDIESATYKHTEGNQKIDEKIANERSADTAEGFDANIVSRHVAFRDAELRRHLRFALKNEDEGTTTSNDRVPLEEAKFEYHLSVPESFNDSTRDAVAQYIHRYLLWGALCDWYGQFGMLQQSAFYESKLPGLLSEIKNLLRSENYLKKPMQPFGPAYRFEK